MIGGLMVEITSHRFNLMPICSWQFYDDSITQKCVSRLLPALVVVVFIQQHVQI